MKIRFILAALYSVFMLSVATAAEGPAKVRLLYSDESHEEVYLYSYKAGTATYKTNLKSLNILQVKKPRLEAVYFYEPELFIQAMDLYRDKNYAEAKTKFAECEEAFKPVDSLPDNYATLAGFYKLECSRKLNDLEALSAELEKYFKSALTRESHLQQLELYAFWDAVRLEDWARLDRLAEAWQGRKLPSELRVQVEYCHALALDALQKDDPSRQQEALNAYSRVLSADATASMDLVLKAATNLLRIYAEDPGVQYSIKNWKGVNEKVNSTGYQRLMEANSLVKYYKLAGFQDLQPLSPEHEKFLQYSPQQVVAAPSQSAEPDVSAPEDSDDAKGEEAADPEAEDGQ
ncbi:MAG: hypothetical protein ACPH2J_07370 [Akkermansiaceae bacterium]